MKIALFWFFVAFIARDSFGSREVEYGHVDDPLFKALGYECLSKDASIGPMKMNETKNARGRCSVSECRSGGFISHTSCLPLLSFLMDESNCKPIDGDWSKPYPECCPFMQC